MNLIILFFICFSSCIYAQNLVKSHSFKAPFYLNNGKIPGFSYGGDTVVEEDFIRLTPNEKSRRGWLWSDQAFVYQNWQVEMEFTVGSPSKLGADGFAFWVTKEKGQSGPVFGNTEMFNGMGVIFDSFDNDNKKDNPMILVVVNDGTKIIDLNDDGAKDAIDRCLFNFRSYPYSTSKPNYVKIVYEDGILSISTKSFHDRNENLCIRRVQVDLPKGNYYMGLTAETGGLSDHHDIMSLQVETVDPIQQVINRINRSGKDKIQNQGSNSRNARQDTPESDNIKSSNIGCDLDFIQDQNYAVEKQIRTITGELEAIAKLTTELSSVYQSTATQESFNQFFDQIMENLVSMDVDILYLERKIEEKQNLVKSINEKIFTIEENVGAAHSEIVGRVISNNEQLESVISEKSSWRFWTLIVIFEIMYFLFLYGFRVMSKKYSRDYF